MVSANKHSGSQRVLLTLTGLAAAIGGGVGGSLANKNKQIPHHPQSLKQVLLQTRILVQARRRVPYRPHPLFRPQHPRPPSPAPGQHSSVPAPPQTTLSTLCTWAQPSSSPTRHAIHAPGDEMVSENFVNQFTASLDDCVGLYAQWNVNNHMSTSGLAQTCGAVCWRNNFHNDYPRNILGMPLAIRVMGALRVILIQITIRLFGSMSPNGHCKISIRDSGAII